MDTQQLLEQIDLRHLAEQAGAHFNNSNRSRCPLHKGDNPTAFSVYHSPNGAWRWHCFTGCPEGANSGDAISFYMRWHDVDFKTAVNELARQAGITLQPTSGALSTPSPTSPMVDSPAHPPSQIWRQRAAEFVQYAQDTLWNPSGKEALCYLHAKRGLTDDTLKQFKLGYNPRDLHDQPQKWGLDGNPIWLPQGIVIPHLRGEVTWFVNVRRPDASGAPKYAGPRGGVRGLYGSNHLRGLPILLLVEGEFDALLAWHSAGDMCDVATLGGARHRLDAHDAALLAPAWVILAALDNDAAADKGRAYLHSVSQRIIAVPPPAHDLTDYWSASGNLRRWIAHLVVEQAEKVLPAIDDEKQPDAFVRWLEVYTLALEARQ